MKWKLYRKRKDGKMIVMESKKCSRPPDTPVKKLHGAGSHIRPTA